MLPRKIVTFSCEIGLHTVHKGQLTLNNQVKDLIKRYKKKNTIQKLCVLASGVIKPIIWSVSVRCRNSDVCEWVSLWLKSEVMYDVASDTTLDEKGRNRRTYTCQGWMCYRNKLQTDTTHNDVMLRKCSSSLIKLQLGTIQMSAVLEKRSHW